MTDRINEPPNRIYAWIEEDRDEWSGEEPAYVFEPTEGFEPYIHCSEAAPEVLLAKLVVMRAEMLAEDAPGWPNTLDAVIEHFTNIRDGNEVSP